MSAVSRALENVRTFRHVDRSPTALALLRLNNAPLVLGLLGEHLGGESGSREAADLYDLIETDLAELREARQPMTRTAQQYCKDWVDQGYLVRRSGRAARSEEFSLSEAAQLALRLIDQVTQPRGAATQSRLTLLSDQLRRLAEETDPDVGRRVQTLAAERARLEQRIAALEDGQVDPLGDEQALESAQELFTLAREVPADFTRVRGALENLHRRLRLDLIEHEGPQGEILDALFLGVDAIESSEEGRSFDAFHELLMDPEQEVAFNAAVDELATRGFASEFGRERLLYLQGYLRRLQRESFSVRTAMTDLSRSLREFVRSRQFEQFRALADALRRPQRLALDVSQHMRAHTRTSVMLELTTFQPSSVGQIHLHVPSDTTVAGHATVHTSAPLDLEALRATVRESEIDMVELTDAVNRVVRERSGTDDAAMGDADAVGDDVSVSVGDVLATHPATQGLASIVGLLVLGARHGSEHAPERVGWDTATGPRAMPWSPRTPSPGRSHEQHR